MTKFHYGVVPPNGTIAVNVQPPLAEGEAVHVISILPAFITVQVMKDDSVVVANRHHKWPIVFVLVRN